MRAQYQSYTLSHWNTAVEQLFETVSPASESLIEACVYAWLDAGSAVLVRAKPLWVPETSDKCDWDALIKRLAANAESVTQIAKRPGPDPRGYGASKWLTRLAYFLWPAVSGIQAKTADRFFKARNLREFWRKNQHEIEQSIEDILKHSTEKGLKDKDAEELRKDWATYLTSNISTSQRGKRRTNEAEAPPPP